MPLASGVRLLRDEAEILGYSGTHCEIVDASPTASDGCELMVVIGGDGTILRAADLARASRTPLLGVNLGHIGFLAEAEHEDIDTTIEAIVNRSYTTEERLTVDVAVYVEQTLVGETWALNEASIEKASRQRMLEVVVEIDGRPLSRWGCDGVVLSTPTGSTAYNFSAGGPIVWPGVQALLLTPISAHALFARPVVVSPTSVLAVEVIADSGVPGVLWCDGRRTCDLEPGARIEVRRGKEPILLARLHAQPFTDRLVRKFELPVAGWRGSTARRQGARARMIEEIRIRSLGVIDESGLELDPGFTAITGETGAGKTMVVTALGLLLGGRADTGAVRTGEKAARIEGVVRLGDWSADIVDRLDELGADVDDDALVVARHVAAEGRSRAFVGGSAVPVSALAEISARLVAVHGQSDQHRLQEPAAQREALDRFAGAEVIALRERFAATYQRLRAVESELAEVLESGRERAREADLLRLGLQEIESVSPEPGEDSALAAEEERLAFADSLRSAAEGARVLLSSDQTDPDAPDALGAIAAARALLEGEREHDEQAAALAGRLAEVSYLVSDLAADVASYAAGLETDPARLAAVSERRAALISLTRKYGQDLAAVLAWAEDGRNPAGPHRQRRRARRAAEAGAVSAPG